MTTRREFLQGVTALGVSVGAPNFLSASAKQSALARIVPAQQVLSGEEIDLRIGRFAFDVDGKRGDAVAVNGSIPGPLLRLREGQDVTIRVKNELDVDTSIHWHGILLPTDMDGVPGLSFPGIKPAQTFTYQYRVRQSGTYWYHSHSGLQEQIGLYGAMVIEPAQPDGRAYAHDHAILLSDWTFESPAHVMARLNKQAGYYNFQKNTIANLLRQDAKQKGLGRAIGDRYHWSKMRMDPTDIADVTGSTFTYLMNGCSPATNWNALFTPGQPVRLRFINGSAATFFDVRVPGLKMKVIAADGNNIEPVVVDEFRIGVAETYDVIVQPETDNAYTIFAETMDRSGYARGTLAPEPQMSAPVPQRRKREMRSMMDMGMAHDHAGMDHSQTKMYRHPKDHHGAGNSMVAEMAMSRLSEPGHGLGKDGRRVLVYTDLRSASPRSESREPDRELELHLTGNMERYMWSFDGKQMSEVKKPIQFRYGERVRLIMINDTMMEHPIHLHGMFFEVENGNAAQNPLKHTVIVKPAERLSVVIDATEPGLWAFHCHILYHMEMGMMRAVQIKKEKDDDSAT